MSNELDLTYELQTQVELLGDKDWRVVMEAHKKLVQAEQAGLTAVLRGLSHESARVRRGCADFLDHHGTDECFDALREVALYDPVPWVRRMAVHSAGCQRCKSCPLTGDLVGLFVQVLLSDPNKRVRETALYGLRYQPQDARAVEVLEKILDSETDPRLRKEAHFALKHQDPEYRARVDAQAKERGIAAARISQRISELERAPQSSS